MNGKNNRRRTQEVEVRSGAIDSAGDGTADNSTGNAERLDEFLTKKELAARLKVSVRTVEQWQHDGHIPYLRVAGVLLFHWPAVVKALTEKFTIRRGGQSVSPRRAE